MTNLYVPAFRSRDTHHARARDVFFDAVRAFHNHINRRTAQLPPGARAVAGNYYLRIALVPINHAVTMW